MSYNAEDVLHASLVFLLDDENDLFSVTESSGIQEDSIQIFGYIVDFRLSEALALEEENVAIEFAIFIDPEWVALPFCVFAPDPNDPALRRAIPTFYDGGAVPADNIVQAHIQFYQFNR